MNQNEREALKTYINENWELASRISNEYITLIDSLVAIEENPRERIKLQFERLQLQVQLRILQGKIEEEIAKLE